MKPGDRVVLVSGVRIVCPFCARHAEIGVFSSGESGALHGWPPCDAFERLSPEAYAAAVRAALERPS